MTRGSYKNLIRTALLRRICYTEEGFSKKDKVNARQAVNGAIRQGHLVKPTICCICHVIDETLSAHHIDYRIPLAVLWVCNDCHLQLHGKLNGFNSAVQPLFKRIVA